MHFSQDLYIYMPVYLYINWHDDQRSIRVFHCSHNYIHKENIAYFWGSDVFVGSIPHPVTVTNEGLDWDSQDFRSLNM